MMRRPMVLGLLGWLAVVVAVSAVTWAAIGTAGQQVLSQYDAVPSVREPVLTQSSTTGPRTPSPGTEPTTPAPGSEKPSTPQQNNPQQSPGPTAYPAPKPPVEPGPETPPNDPPPDPDSEPGPSSGARAPATPEGGRSEPDYEQRTWQGRAGSVTVRCDGQVASLQSATPNDGYQVEVRERGPEEVEVRFESEDEEVKVDASCSDGAPRFSADR